MTAVILFFGDFTMARRKNPVVENKDFTLNINFYNKWKTLICESSIYENSFFKFYTLAIVAKKCDVPFDELLSTASEIYEEHMKDEWSFSRDDLYTALMIYYDDEARYVKTKLLCQLAGVEYVKKAEKPTPYLDAYYAEKEAEAARNGTTYEREKFSRGESFRKFALEKGREALRKKVQEDPNFYKKINSGRKSAVGKVQEWHEKNPYGLYSKCAKELGIARKTALKHYHSLGYSLTTEEIVKEYRENNPNNKVKDCIEATGFSERTIRRYWKKRKKENPDCTANPGNTDS